MEYRVGQVLFLLLQKDKKVLPVQVVEQIVRKTLSEENVSYNIRFPDKKMTVASLDSIEAQIFTTAQETKQLMVDSAVEAIDKIVNIAINVAENRFGALEVPNEMESEVSAAIRETKLESLPLIDSEDPGEVELEDFSNAQIDLGGGVKATVRSIGN